MDKPATTSITTTIKRELYIATPGGLIKCQLPAEFVGREIDMFASPDWRTGLCHTFVLETGNDFEHVRFT